MLSLNMPVTSAYRMFRVNLHFNISPNYNSLCSGRALEKYQYIKMDMTFPAKGQRSSWRTNELFLNEMIGDSVRSV